MQFINSLVADISVIGIYSVVIQDSPQTGNIPV
jgi:hypothetical protein